MHVISPNTGAPESVLDPEGKVFNPLPVALYRDAADPKITVVLTRWQPSDEERAALHAAFERGSEQARLGQVVDADEVIRGLLVRR